MRSVWISLWLVGCHSTVAPVTAKVVASPAGVRAGQYLGLYERLVAQIGAEHAFSPSYQRVVGRAWSEEVEALRPEFAAATSRDEVVVALEHLQASLRDEHCWYTAPSGVHERRLGLGFRLFVDDAPDSKRAFVQSVARADTREKLSVGDEVVAIDGMPLDAFVHAHRFWSNAINPAKHRERVLQRALRTRWAPGLDGNEAMRRLTVLRDGNPRELSLSFGALTTPPDELDLDRAPPIERFPCEEDPPRYGHGYAVTGYGNNLCVYTSKQPAYRDAPIVHWLSFLYADDVPAHAFRRIRLDHDVLARTLHGARRVVLDLRHNPGGQNPFVFLRWFAQKPYAHELVHARVSPRVRSGEELESIFYGDKDAIGAWQGAVRDRKPEATFRFLCASDCVEGPMPADQVSAAPVAVITGPDCVSSCDTFALSFQAFGLGALVGRQPALGFTVNREVVPVRQPGADQELGTLRIAVSWSTLETLGTESIEGVPRTLDRYVPRRFADRDRQDQLDVDAALEALGSRTR